MPSLENAVPDISEPPIDRDRRWTARWYPFIQGLLEKAKDAATSVTTLTEIIDGVSATWTLSVNVANRVVGMAKFDGSATSSTFAVLANKFVVISPGSDSISTTAFTVGDVNGVSTVGIAADQVIIDGSITADQIAANTIDVSKLTAVNLDVLNGTFGLLRTNATSTRVQITDTTNDMVVYSGGTAVLRIGGSISTAQIEMLSSTAAIYGGQFTNTSTSGGGSSNGGGAIAVESNGGFAASFLNHNTQAGALGTFAAVFLNDGTTGAGATNAGGLGRAAASAGSGGWAFYAAHGAYGPFTGAHDGLLRKYRSAIEPGDIMIDGDLIGRTLSDCITEMTASSEPNQRGALGVLVSRRPITDVGDPPPSMTTGDAWDDAHRWLQIAETHDALVVNALGEGCVNVCGEGGDIAKGDLIVTSSRLGKGMRQADDCVRSYTVARAREAASFSGDETKMIACIYLCG